MYILSVADNADYVFCIVAIFTLLKKGKNMSEKKIDWRLCAEALNRKLNQIAARLQETERTATSFDIVAYCRSLREEFHLETDSDFVKPDFIALIDSFDELKHRLFEYRYFCNRTVGDYQKILDLASDFSIALAIQGAFV